MDDEAQSAANNDMGKRSRSRKNVVGGSKNRDEYVRLLESGWSSLALSRYAQLRHGEDIPASTFRTYRKRVGITVTESEMRGRTDIDPDALLDIVHERTELIRLQKERIAIDAKHERQMNKLFSTTKGEIRELATLINESKADLQDLGVFPKSGTLHQLNVNATPGEQSGPPDDGRIRYTPAAKTLGQVVGDEVTEEQQAQLARMLHDLLPPEIEQVNGNGHGPMVIDGDTA